MAEETKLEQIAKNAPQQEKKEEKVINLETRVMNVFGESWHAVKQSAKLGLAAILPYSLVKLFPYATLDIGTWTAANVAADSTTNLKKGKKNTAGEVFNSSAVATATAMPIHYTYRAINQISLDSALGYLGRAAAFGGLAYPALVGMYQTADYLIRNLKFRGLGNYLKENYWPTLKKAWKYVFPISLLNIFFVPAYLQVAVGSALGYLFALFGAPKKEELKEHEKREKQSYLAAFSNALGKASRPVVYGVPKALHAIGSTIVEKFYKAAQTPAKAPVAQPA